MLNRLANIGATAEAIVHHPRTGQMISSWTRVQAVAGIRFLVAVLREGRPLLLVGALNEAIVAEAIQGNDYFVRLADADPRLNGVAIRQADDLRRRIAGLIRFPVGMVPLGPGRNRRQWAAARRQVEAGALAPGTLTPGAGARGTGD